MPRRFLHMAALPFLPVLCAGAALRFLGLGNQSLWRDEANTIHYASRESLAEAIRWLASGDVHPPLYDILLRIWIGGFGESIAALRGLSALFGVVSIWLVYRTGRILLDRRAGLVAACLHATALMPIYYAQEARSYSMLAALAIASNHAFVRWLAAPRRRRAVCYVLATAALLYTHAFGMFVPLAQGAFLLPSLIATRRIAGRDRLRAPGPAASFLGWTKVIAWTGLIYLPWIPVLLRQTHSPAKAWILEPDLGTPAETLLMFLSIAKPPWNHPPPDWDRILAAFLIGAPLLAGASLWIARRHRTDREGGQRLRKRAALGHPAGLAWAWLLVPMAAAWIVSKVSMPIYTHRNLILCAPALHMLLAAAVTRIRPRVAGAILLAGLLSFSCGNLVWYYTAVHKEDWRGAERYIQENFRPTDQLLLVERGPLSWLPSSYYLDLGKLTSQYPATIAPGRDEAAGERIWTLGFRPRGPNQELLRRGYRLVESREFYDGVTVDLYQR